MYTWIHDKTFTELWLREGFWPLQYSDIVALAAAAKSSSEGPAMPMYSIVLCAWHANLSPVKVCTMCQKTACQLTSMHCD